MSRRPPDGWPPNTALKGWRIGRGYRITTKDGCVVTGRYAGGSGERVTLIGPAGYFRVDTGAILVRSDIDTM